jgi:hypothetical protein
MTLGLSEREPRSSKSPGAEPRTTAIDDPGPDRQHPSEIAGDAYAALIADTLAGQRARKESFERRGFSVITSSGVIASVLLGISAVVVSGENKPPGLARWAFVSALVLFATAFVLGIVANIPRSHQQTRSEHLRPLLEDRFWLGRSAVGKFRSTEVRVSMLEWSEGVNDKLGHVLIVALVAELLAILAVAVALGSLVGAS